MKNLISTGKKAVLGLMMAGVIATGSLMDMVATKIGELTSASKTPSLSLATIQGNSLMAVAGPSVKPIKKINMVITAYSSTPEETDDTPFITASNTSVRDGIVANNLLAFGTRIRIPSVYGDKIFEVEDRMNSKKSIYHLDIWFDSHEKAKNFGAKTAPIEILD